MKDIVRALNNSKGSSKEYLQVISELRGLELALIQVKAQYDDISHQGQKDALRQAVAKCDGSIKDSLDGLSKYHGHLSVIGSGNRWKDAVRKIQWRFCKAEELTNFRLRISLHVGEIEMLLATIQTTQLSQSKLSAQAQVQEMRGQSASISVISDSLQNIIKSLEQIKTACLQSCESNTQTLLEIKSTKQLLTSQHIENLRAHQTIQDSLPAQVLLQKPIMFLDALGRRAPIHLEWVNSYEVFAASLKARFKDHGLQLIEDKRFVVQATKTKQDVDFNREWGLCLLSGRDYDMSMLFKGSGRSSSVACTSCHCACTGNPGEDITCGNCDTTFRRIVDVSDNNTSQDDETRHPAWSSKDQTEQDQPSNNINRKHEFQMRDFQRVRIIYSTNESSVGLWCDVCKKNRALPYDVHQSFRDGGKSICWSCLNELNLSDASGMTSSENRDSDPLRFGQLPSSAQPYRHRGIRRKIMSVKPRTRLTQGDVILISYLDPNRPDIAAAECDLHFASESGDDHESRDKVLQHRRITEAPAFSNLSNTVPFSPASRKIKSRVGDAGRSRRLYFERNTGKARPFSDLSDSVPSKRRRVNFDVSGEFSSSRPFDELEQGTHPKAKTLVCRFWQEGKCKKGDDCTFIHKS